MIICDKCRNEVKEDKIFYLKITQEALHGRNRIGISTYMSYELCDKCKEQIKEIIKDWEMGKK